MSRVNALAGSERTQGKPLPCQTDSNWLTPLITGLWKMRNQGRHLSPQKGWEEFIQAACMGTVSNLPLHDSSDRPTSPGAKTLAPVKPEPISCVARLHTSERLQLWQLDTISGFPVSTCQFYFLLHFHSFLLPCTNGKSGRYCAYTAGPGGG